MERLTRRLLFFVLTLAVAGRSGWAQGGGGGSNAAVVGYAVTGRVLCADTQRPARFAQVTLISASASTGDYDRSRRAVGRTDLEGRFTIDSVPPGDYFATAEMTGYVDEAGAVQNALSAGGDALNAVAAVPRVQVTAGGGSVQLSLQRGGILAGTVQWDDGSPAAGISVAALPAATGSGQSFGSSDTAGGLVPNRTGALRSAGSQTDDRGRFRLSGLSPGPYILRANLQSPVGSSSPGGGRFPRLMTLRIFAPGKQRQTEATVYTVSAGEERGDISVVLNLSGMHSVTGQVSSPAASVHGGFVQLTDQTDSTLNRRGEIGPDGSFLIAYVPPGTYSLRVTANSQAPGQVRGSDAAVRFQPLQESVTVSDSDLTGLAITVTPATATP